MKNIYTLIIAFASFFMLTGCEENDIPTYSGPEYVQFAQSSGKFSVKENGNRIYEITVGTTVPVPTDLNLTIDVDTKSSSAIEGRDFRLLTPVVTIPAGEIAATVKVEGFYENLPSEGVKLVLNILGADELINPNFGNSYTLTLSQFYELTMEKLVGAYTQKSYNPDGSVDEGTITIQKVSDTEIEILNFTGFEPRIKATVNYENATISILPNQVLKPNYIDENGKKYGDLTMIKADMSSEGLNIYERDAILGECTSTGKIVLDGWALVSFEAQTYFFFYSKTEFIKK